jgi:hypothetical protein
VLHRGGSAGHLRDRATSHRRCLEPLASHPTPRPLWPGLLHVQGHRVVEEAYEVKGRDLEDSPPGRAGSP